ncbi:hypothetical protein DFP72DRAFT_1072372 [Ephemerocybe angulata]|uniref:HNH nuclease domain-containing protein n=1 Tax=Ephemerocybe angulata TaxID=980116 RepID=A0A8H6HQ78_9AGAR|nr:hypothetical protein DFP72DRAFT_1072372 [Tulosesus angulatus]
MSKLPNHLPEDLQTNEELRSAYSAVRDAECAVEKSMPESTASESSLQLEKALISIRILGYLLVYAPGNDPRYALAFDVRSCEGSHDKLLELGNWYFDHIARLLRYSKQRAERSSNPQSHCSSDWVNGPTEPILGVPSTHDDAESLVKLRDNFRCLLTGCPDRRAFKEGDRKFREGVLTENCDGLLSSTYGCHIINLVTDSRVRSGDYSMSTWAILQRLGLQSVLEELRGHGVHRLENMITATSDAHMLFNELQIWFSPVPNRPNVYEIHHNLERWEFYAKVRAGEIELKTPDPEKCPLPSLRYLEIHAACARVAHFSGAGTYIYKHLWKDDGEMPPVLDADGSSAWLLAHLLANKVG